MLSKRTKTIVTVAALVVAVSAYGVYRYRRAHDQPEFTFDTAQVDRGPVIAKVTATGTLSAIVTVQVGSQVSGRIAALYADFNSPVKKGELIAKIDPQLFEATVAQARANDVAAEGNLAKAKAQAVDAERQYTRNQELAARKLIAQADLDTAQANADAAKAQVEAARGSVEQAKAALHQAEVNLAYTDIVSPTDGTVISRNVDVGQTVAASLQAPTLFLIAEDLRKMQVDTSVAEADVGRLTQGMKATFTVDAYPNETFVGTVRQIRNAPQTVQNVVTYDAVIDVANPDLKLKPGMTANCTFVYAQRNDVLRLPNAALRFRPTAALLAYANAEPNGLGHGAGGPMTASNHGLQSEVGGAVHPSRRSEDPDRRTVWVLRGTRPVPVQVETGITNGTVTEVLSGDLHAGDTVITDIISGPGSGRAGARPRMMF